jgi:hypothetical protein
MVGLLDARRGDRSRGEMGFGRPEDHRSGTALHDGSTSANRSDTLEGKQEPGVNFS